MAKLSELEFKAEQTSTYLRFFLVEYTHVYPLSTINSNVEQGISGSSAR